MWNYHQIIKDQMKYHKGYPPISLENIKKRIRNSIDLSKTRQLVLTDSGERHLDLFLYDHSQ